MMRFAFGRIKFEKIYKLEIEINANWKLWTLEEAPLMVQKSQTTTRDVQNPVNNGLNYQPQLVIAGFLNHQQYFPLYGVIFWIYPTFNALEARALCSRAFANCLASAGSSILKHPKSSKLCVCVFLSGQINIIPKPELRVFWGSSLIKPPFRVTSADVVIICPDFYW